MKANRRLPSFELLEDRRVPAGFIAVGTDAGLVATVRLFADRDDNDTYESTTAVMQPFGNFTGGVRVALGNTNNIGGDELIVAAGPGAAPIVKVYTDANANRLVSDNAVVEAFLAYPASYHGGVYVAAGAVDGAGNGGAEV